MFKQIVHPINRISQLNVLYRIVSKKIPRYTALLYTDENFPRTEEQHEELFQSESEEEEFEGFMEEDIDYNCGYKYSH